MPVAGVKELFGNGDGTRRSWISKVVGELPEVLNVL